tara:strand:- start:893 stop:1525 length:633 start_codon:yes stop_codon:yes gene_type:complete
MGINSTGTSYNFGQLGSVTCQTATPVVPPQGMVITAIQFLADNTPTVLKSENLGVTGPNFFSTEAADHVNYNGVTEVNVTNGTYAAGANITIASADTKIKVGQYVLLIAQGDTIDNGITVDSETPIPIYGGPSNQGVFVTAYANTTTSLQLSAQITPSSQSLVFLDNYNGAGGNDATGITYPKGLTIVGRYTTITPEADADGGVICYFGY